MFKKSTKKTLLLPPGRTNTSTGSFGEISSVQSQYSQELENISPAPTSKKISRGKSSTKARNPKGIKQSKPSSGITTLQFFFRTKLAGQL